MTNVPASLANPSWDGMDPLQEGSLYQKDIPSCPGWERNRAGVLCPYPLGRPGHCLVMPWGTPLPPTDRVDTIENITFPQPTRAGGKITVLQDHFSYHPFLHQFKVDLQNGFHILTYSTLIPTGAVCTNLRGGDAVDDIDVTL